MNVAGKKEIVGSEKNQVEKRKQRGRREGERALRTGRAHEASVEESAIRKIRGMSISEGGDNTKLPRQSPVRSRELDWVGLC